MFFKIYLVSERSILLQITLVQYSPLPTLQKLAFSSIYFYVSFNTIVDALSQTILRRRISFSSYISVYSSQKTYYFITKQILLITNRLIRFQTSSFRRSSRNSRREAYSSPSTIKLYVLSLIFLYSYRSNLIVSLQILIALSTLFLLTISLVV